MADKKLKVYCETSFWFYLTGRQTDDEKIARWQALTLKWWREFASRCDIYISQHVQMESSDGGAEYVARRQEKMTAASILDAHVDEVEDLAAALTKGHAVPVGEATDAAHIATAAVYGMDVLLTWNCKHMANPVTLPKASAVIVKNGFDCPIIITPEEFLVRKEEFAL